MSLLVVPSDTFVIIDVQLRRPAGAPMPFAKFEMNMRTGVGELSALQPQLNKREIERSLDALDDMVREVRRRIKSGAAW